QDIDGSADRECEVFYRPVGRTQWRQAQPLIWDSAIGPRYSGSVVNLQAGVRYEFRLTLPGGVSETVVQSTWSDNFPIARRVELPPRLDSTFVITEGGSAETGYVLYEAHPEGTVIDVDPTDGDESDAADYGVEIRAPYVILRGVTIRDARIHGVFLNKGTGDGLHDVVIEGCDITNWGRRNALAGKRVTVQGEAGILVPPNLGTHLDCGIFANGSNVRRIIIQGNKIHHPRYTSNNWTQAAGEYFRNSLHPEGPKAVVLYEPGVDVPVGGNHVIRFNEIYGDEDHAFNDALFEGFGGAPHLRGNDAVADTDVNNNFIADVWDDAIEIERSIANVRVFENYFTRVNKGVSFHLDEDLARVGPFYLFRNVFDGSRNPCRPPSSVVPNPHYNDRYTRLTGRVGMMQPLIVGRNRVYVFHNTFLNPDDRGFPFIYGNDRHLLTFDSLIPGQTNLVSRNNIYQTSTSWPHGSPARPRAKTTHQANAVPPPKGPVPFDGDLHNGVIESPAARGDGCVRGEPRFESGRQPDAGGQYELAASSPGVNGGAVLPNFNDDFVGAAPDA
ncbi:MAG TPA: hypothetical protein PKB10_13030, partial [Tepidisphaeraceae bacterium]|nr:hypothetical protein [Tepidisphaeraceae bacterium]